MQMAHTADRDDIHFTVARGEIFGRLGPKAASKTTAIEILEGLRRADAGQVSLAPLCMLP
jgi:ABC-2 type transport system ATP-binding protein